MQHACRVPCEASLRNGDCPCCRAASRGALLYPFRVARDFLRAHRIEAEVFVAVAAFVLMGWAARWLA